MLTPLAAILPGFHHQSSVFVLGTEPTRFISADPTRAMIYITNNGNQPLELWIGPADPGDDPPHFLVNPAQTERLSWQNDGPMSTYSWYGAAASGTNRVSIIEVFWHPEQLIGSAVGG